MRSTENRVELRRFLKSGTSSVSDTSSIGRRLMMTTRAKVLRTLLIVKAEVAYWNLDPRDSRPPSGQLICVIQLRSC